MQLSVRRRIVSAANGIVDVRQCLVGCGVVALRGVGYHERTPSGHSADSDFINK